MMHQNWFLRLVTPIFFFCSLNFASAEPVKIKILTLNVWGLPGVIVKDAGERFDLIRKHIESQNYDFVFFQEAFSALARTNLRTPVLPYYTNGPRHHGRLESSGIRILSKYPILRMATLGYADCIKDDCLAHKGAVLVVVELPNKTKLNLVTTHLNARGGDAIRQKQVDQLKLFIDFYAEKNSPVLLGGDFNFGPSTEPYQYVLNHLNVTDAWRNIKGSEDGFTYDTTDNKYAYDYCMKHKFELGRDRIDFLFPSFGIKTLSADRLFTTAPLVSDHFGLTAEFEVQ